MTLTYSSPEFVMISKYLYAMCEANNVEKPGAVIPHAGICEGQSGNWLSYLDGSRKSGKDMKTFKVYQHPTFGYEAVKVGFSWPAFFFGLFWMLLKKLWGFAALWFVLYFALNIIEAIIDLSGTEPGLQAIVHFALAGGYFTFALIPGLDGNGWRSGNLEKRGYGFIQRVEAETPDAAIAKVAKSRNKQQVEIA